MIVGGWERHRAVTLQFLDALDEEELGWRPTPESMSCGQQLLHIAQAEDFHERGLFSGEWNRDLLRFPKPMPSKDGLRARFEQVRGRTAARLAAVTPADLDAPCQHPNAPSGLNLRWWLTFLLEHEVHRKGQLAVYFRLMGKEAPFFAMALPVGQRPDIQASRDLGGVWQESRTGDDPGRACLRAVPAVATSGSGAQRRARTSASAASRSRA